MIRYAALAVAAMSLCAPTTAAQQQAADPTSTPDPTIIVTGQPATDKELIRRLTRTISSPVDGQIARFSDQVCPGVRGLDAPYAARLVDRIRRIAADAKIGIDRPSCQPNLLIVFVENGHAVVNGLARKTQLFEVIDKAEKSRILKDAGPVHVLSLTELRSRDGNRVSGNGILYLQSASIMGPTTRQDIYQVIILLDRPATIGKTLGQIADYTAMRGLARTRTALRDTDDSILTLFNPYATPPKRLTTFDAAYLKALYYGPATGNHLHKASAMSRRIDTLLKAGVAKP